MTLSRIIVTLSILIFAFPLKWFIAIGCARLGWGLKGLSLAPFDSGKEFRFLGWDFASASWTLFVASLFSSQSAFRGILSGVQEFGVRACLIGLYFVIFLALYCSAIYARYVVVAGAEQSRLYQWRSAGWSWLFGLLLLGFCCSMALR